MQKYSLLQSVQGGPFTNSSRMIDIDIPYGNLVDMTQSFIQLETSITPNTTIFTKGVSNLILVNTQFPEIAPMNVDLVKNAYLSSATKGKLEDIRRVNILSHNLQEFTKSTAEKTSLINSLTQYNSFSDLVQFSPFIETRKLGNVQSVYKNNYLRIPLADLFQLGLVDTFDTSKFGTCRVHLELDNLNYYSVALKKNLAPSDELGPVDEKDAITSGYDILMHKQYDTLKAVPFFVGQFVSLSFKTYVNDVTDSSPPEQADVVITKIVYDEPSGSLVITTDHNFPAVLDTTYSEITLKDIIVPEGVTTLGAFNILTAQLGLCTIEGASMSPNEISYLTFTTEEYNAGGQAFMNKIFEIEPECVNAFLMQYDPATPSNLLSNGIDIQSYRLRIDGNDVVDRDVLTNIDGNNPYAPNPLHYELLNRTFLNASFTLKNLTGTSLARAQPIQAERFLNPGNQLLLICCPTPMTADTKKFQVNISTNGHLSNVILFKHVLRTIKL